jgi:hypothetical protein
MEGEGCAASVREAAATPEGRAALRAWATRLHAGSDVLAAAEERTVSCILSAWRPVIVETRDNLSRRLAGPAFSNAFYRLSANPFFQVFFGMWTVLIAAVCPLCAVGVLSPQVALFVWTIEFMCFSSTWALFSWPLLVIIWQCVPPRCAAPPTCAIQLSHHHLVLGSLARLQNTDDGTFGT